MSNIDATNGECLICGLPGTVGLHCSDPDCQGLVEKIEDGNSKAEGEVSDRYDDDDLKTDNVVSLEEVAEEELAEDD